MGSFIKDYIELYYASRKENTVCDFMNFICAGRQISVNRYVYKKIGDAAFNEGF